MPVASSPHTTNSPVDERIQEEAALWFARLRGDEVSDYEHADFAAWLSADARHRSEYDAFQRMWDASAELRPTKPRRRQVLRTLPYPIKRLEVIRWFNQKSMVFNQSLS